MQSVICVRGEVVKIDAAVREKTKFLWAGLTGDEQ